MLSAREMAGFRRALLQAWLFLQGRDKLNSSPLIPTPANVCSAGNDTPGDGTRLWHPLRRRRVGREKVKRRGRRSEEELEEDGVKEDEEKKGEEN